MTTNQRLVAAVLAPVLALAGCGHPLHPDFDVPYICRTEAPVTDSIFLIGDAGDPMLPDDGSSELIDPVLSSLRRRVDARVAMLGADHTAVIFLGDNVYPSGLAPPGHGDRARGERVLDAQVAAVGEARGYFTPGNHDWNQAKKDGLERALTQYEYLSNVSSKIEVHPAAPCAGPSVVDMGEKLRLVFGDLWSAIYHQNFPGSVIAACDPEPGEGRVSQRFKQIFDATTERRIVFAIHAPLITSGPHGGYFPWREHIFPLRVFHRNLWIPLPIIGSIFPLSRWMGVTDTDLMSSNYRSYVTSARSTFRPGEPAIVAAGHEHSLQLHVDGLGTFHAVSGAGSKSKVDYVRRLRSDLMSLAAPGYMRLDEHADGTLALKVIVLDDDDVDQPVFYTCVP
jgi:hypothetical protein